MVIIKESLTCTSLILVTSCCTFVLVIAKQYVVYLLLFGNLVFLHFYFWLGLRSKFVNFN